MGEAITIEIDVLERLIERAVTRALAKQGPASDERWLTPAEAAKQYRVDRRYVVALCEQDALKARRQRCRGGRMGWKIDPAAAATVLGAKTLFHVPSVKGGAA